MKPQDDSVLNYQMTYNTLTELVVSLNTNNVDKTTAIMILENLIRDLIARNQQQDDSNKIIAMYVSRVRAGDLRYASSFFGHWAKQHEESSNENY